ncbi:MAG: 2,4-dihydroxyhept-2-ene,7-dioic acid aldolase [Caulobacter sp.]|nr:2,4-dihydroxyhept-2-ene,7-dioic acid aldolase [Caulobacter sp.]
MRSTAKVATDKAARYLSQLTKHFAHRLPATLDGRHEGRIELPFGVCALAAETGTLHLSVEAENVMDLTRMEKVIADHLVRFMFREPPGEVAWSWA